MLLQISHLCTSFPPLQLISDAGYQNEITSATTASKDFDVFVSLFSSHLNGLVGATKPHLFQSHLNDILVSGILLEYQIWFCVIETKTINVLYFDWLVF